MLVPFVSGDKPHACDLCNKKFALACNLRAHMKTHEGERLFTFVFLPTPYKLYQLLYKFFQVTLNAIYNVESNM